MINVNDSTILISWVSYSRKSSINCEALEAEVGAMVEPQANVPGPTVGHKSARAMAVAASLLMLSGCSSVAPGSSASPSGPVTCPSHIEDLRDPALRARLGSDFVAGTGIVNRYVDSPDSAYRGYDLEITRRIAGLAEADQVMFAVADAPLSDIELGAEVLVVGRRGPRTAEIQASGCPVLIPIEP